MNYLRNVLPRNLQKKKNYLKQVECSLPTDACRVINN